METQEKILWQSHPFFWKYFYWLVLAHVFFLIVLIAAIWLWILALVAAIAFVILLIPLCMQIYRWKRIHYRISDERIVIKTGIFNIHEKSIMIQKIENFEVVRTLIDRLFNTGDIIFLTEGESTEGSLNDVPTINEVEKILTDLLGPPQ